MMNVAEIYKKASDLYFEEKESKRKNKPIESWYISGFGSCMVARYLKRIGKVEETKPDDRLREVFDIGNIEEQLVVDRLNFLKDYEIQTQGRIENKHLGISGYYDIKLTDKNTKEKHIVEVKSKHSRAFWYMDKKGEGANFHHKLQLWAYLFLTGIETGSILYRSKDDRCILCYPIFRSDYDLKKAFMDELYILNYCLKNNKIPPLPEPKSWQEQYCDCHQTCREFSKESLTQDEINKLLVNNEYLTYEI